jgi:plastocyanin
MAEHGAAACAACGSALRPDQRFCPTCGTAIPPARPVEVIFSLPAPAPASPEHEPAPLVQGTLTPQRRSEEREARSERSPYPSHFSRLTPHSSRGGEGGRPQAGVKALPGPAYGLIALLLIGGGTVVAWAVALGDDIPAFATVLDFKVTLATAVLLLAATQLVTAAVFYGWVRPPWPSADAATFVHRWSGRGLLVAAALVTVYCVKDIGPQAEPVRVALHSMAGSAVFLVVAAKLLILRGVPRLSGLVPVLGATAAVLFVALWLTSALFTLRARAQGYTTAETGATVAIVSDPQTIGRFAPLLVRVRVGQAVQWVNQDSAPHNVVRDGGGFDSGVLVTGAGFRWPARQPGTVTYRCTLHPQMAVATVVVEDK